MSKMKGRGHIVTQEHHAPFTTAFTHTPLDSCKGPIKALQGIINAPLLPKSSMSLKRDAFQQENYVKKMMKMMMMMTCSTP